MKRLTSPEVLELHGIAVADKRLGKPDRLILCEVARTGHVGNVNHLATVGSVKAPDVPKRLAKLRDLGYLPAAS